MQYVIEEVLHLASGPQCLKAAGKVSCLWLVMATLCSVLFMCQRSSSSLNIIASVHIPSMEQFLIYTPI